MNRTSLSIIGSISIMALFAVIMQLAGPSDSPRFILFQLSFQGLYWPMFVFDSLYPTDSSLVILVALIFNLCFYGFLIYIALGWLPRFRKDTFIK